MKKIITLVLGIFLCFTLASTAFADETTEGFIHNPVGLLKAEEKQKLEKEAQDIYNKYKIKAQLLLLDVEQDKLVDKFKEYYGNSFTVESGVILTACRQFFLPELPLFQEFSLVKYHLNIALKVVKLGTIVVITIYLL